MRCSTRLTPNSDPLQLWTRSIQQIPLILRYLVVSGETVLARAVARITVAEQTKCASEEHSTLIADEIERI